MYELKVHWSGLFIERSSSIPDYYLTVSFDDQDRVSMIVYQENKKVHIMTDGLNA